MSRLAAALRSVITGSREAPVARRLERERPGPAPSFARELGRQLETRWTQTARPANLILTLFVLFTLAAVALGVAAIVAGS